MTNELRQLAKDLKAFAKRCKEFKYTESALFAFPLLGLTSFAETSTTDKAIQNQRQEISTSIGDMRQQFRKIKTENDKLMKDYNLELIQLMEQGDHVVKSPWSSWQYGANTILNDWHGSYKGRGDKKEKYPYEGVLKRDSNAYNRYISKESSMYQYLPQSSDPSSASTNSRKGYGSYGLASNKTVPEPPVSFEISASIKPRIVTKGAITVPAPAALEPTLPKAIDFKPVTPKINSPKAPKIEIPEIKPPSTGNGDDMYIKKGSQNDKFIGTLANDYVGMIAQQRIDAKIAGTPGELNVKVADNLGPRDGHLDISWKGVKFTGQQGAGHTTTTTYSNDETTTGYEGYAAMKLVGGHRIDINDVKIKFEGNGTNTYGKWLFHTDGHNNYGDSTWVIGSGTTIDINGIKLAMYTAQYHTHSWNPTHYATENNNIGFQNNGNITTEGSENYLWLTLAATGGFNRVMWFENTGSITLGGNGDTVGVIGSEYANKGGFSFMNTGTIALNGVNQKGIVVNNKLLNSSSSVNNGYPGAEIILEEPIQVNGSKSVGVALKTFVDLDGEEDFSEGAGASTNANERASSVRKFDNKTRESNLKVDLKGSENTGLYFEHSNVATNPFKVSNYTLKSSEGIGNALVYIKDGYVELAAKNKSNKDNKMTITDGNSNIGIYTAATGKTLKTGASITITNSDSSTGIFAKKSGDVTNTGDISATGKSVKAIISEGTKIESSGTITVNGTALSATDGSVGLASMNGGNLIQTGATNITVGGSASIGLYADGKVDPEPPAAPLTTATPTTLKITGGTVTAKEGAFNTYAANSGTITLDGVTLNTEPKSLAFYTTDGGKIDFGTGSMNTANIKGGTDANSRGTAFLYKGAGATYTPFTPGAISAWAGANFANLNKLTLNMEQGSRLFIAQNVAMDLTGTGPGGIAGALPGVTFTGSNDYKTFMLYLSKLTLDQDINLDNPLDAYNKLEISNSTIENNNSKTITGTSAGQVAIAQENDTTLDRDKVKLINSGNINLSGANSTAIYGKFAEITNETTGTINVADSSAALYGTTDSKIENKGNINLGTNSVGIFSKGDTATGYTVGANTYKGSVVNSGNIISTGKAIGITYEGTGAGNTDTRVTNDTNGKINLAGEGSVGIYALGSNYKILNNGEINLGNSSSLTTNPNVGIYTAVESVKIDNAGTGKITVGNESVGVYGYDIDNAGQITAGDNGIGIYSKKLSTGPSTVNHTGTITVGNNDATGIFLEDGGTLNFNSGAINVGDNSYGIVAIGSSPFNYTNNAAATVTLGNGSTYFYSNNPTTNFTNNIALNNPSGVGIYGISSPGTIVNNANFTLGDQSVGILNTGNGIATNNATIVVGNSDTGSKNYAIGMATTTGKVVNSGSGVITVGADGIGLFADGANAQAENAGTINIAGDRGMGIYLDHGAKGVNNGTITTVGTPTGAVGVVVQHKAELTNNGTININSPAGYAMFKATGGVIKNYGTITLGSGATETFDPTSKPTSKTAGGISINAPTGATPATTTVTTINHGTISSIVSPEHVIINTPQGPAGPSPTSLGIYVDTLGSTNPISGNLGLITDEADLIIGTEAARTTNSKNIVVSGAVLDPYVQMMDANSGVTWNAYGGSLTWIATPLYSNGQLGSVVLAKLPYTEFAGNETTPVNSSDTYNFLHGLDDRYGVDWYGDRGAREKQLFNKLNEIGKNEEALFYQATDEMMGHQYGNVQQRINETGSLLDKEFKYLRNDWRNPSKQNNKIKVFGMRNEYNTDTAGIIDYTSNAYGVAYVHEDETLKLGNSSGWYAGAVNNRFKFKDIGRSRENQTMVKAGIFKTMSPYMDHNGSLRWTVAGDVFAGRNEMKRRFLVVDDVFGAKGDYTSYGAAFKTDLGYDIRMSERTHLRPYGALKMEYGRFNSIKEDDGEVRLEVKGNDYFSVKPEVGMEFKYVQPMAVRTQLSVGLTAAYENELGRVADGKNVARVRFTDADWFGIRGEKEDRRGSGKFDLNIGVDNTRFGVTANLGYDTKGSNIRGGIGFRAIY